MQKLTPEVSIQIDHEFPSFSVREVQFFQLGHTHRFRLLLPFSRKIDQLLEDLSTHALEQEIQQEEAVRLLEEARCPPDLSTRIRPAAQHDTDRVIDERKNLKKQFHEQQAHFDHEDVAGLAHVQIYQFEEPLKLIERKRTALKKDLGDRDEQMFADLKARGAFRSIADRTVLSHSLIALKNLRRQQPHFDSVVDVIEGRVSLALELGQPLQLPAVLLAGPPGVGKTHFSLQLAQALNQPIHRHSFDASHTASALTGSDRHWSNSEIGLVFKSVCMADRADPVLLLDEIDKATVYTGGNPLAPLHSLLEPVTARAIKDISAGIEFDASHVTWIATANNPSDVPETILSRFTVFHIQPPSAEHAIELAQAVAASLHSLHPGFEVPSRRLITRLAHLTPREQIQAMKQTYAHALANGRKRLLLSDLPADLQLEEFEDSSSRAVLH